MPGSGSPASTMRSDNSCVSGFTGADFGGNHGATAEAREGLRLMDHVAGSGPGAADISHEAQHVRLRGPQARKTAFVRKNPGEGFMNRLPGCIGIAGRAIPRF